MSALAIDPVYVKALCRRAMAREKMGKLPEALLDLTAACMLSGFQNEMATSNTDRLIKEVGRLTPLLTLSLTLTLTPTPRWTRPSPTSTTAPTSRWP